MINLICEIFWGVFVMAVAAGAVYFILNEL